MQLFDFLALKSSVYLLYYNWRVAVLGDGGVGKTALAVQVCTSLSTASPFSDS